jgi:hypothetical protein
MDKRKETETKPERKKGRNKEKKKENKKKGQFVRYRLSWEVSKIKVDFCVR